MSDSLYHDEAGVSNVVTDALNKISNYETVIGQLESLVNRINSSDDWIDVAVKTAYISKCNDYINLCKSFVKALRDYVNNYLASKSTEIAGIERAFS